MDKELKKDLDDIKRLLTGVVMSLATLAKMYQFEEQSLEGPSFDKFMNTLDEIVEPVDLIEELKK